MLGRDEELAAGARAVEEVARGATRTLCLIGEAGIGKSALLGAIADTARDRDVLVLEGVAAEHERDVPFGVVIDALDDHVATLHPRRLDALGPDLGAVLPAASTTVPVPAGAGAAERFRYHRALRALVETLGRERPVALLLDDLHWADEASVELVAHLLRRPPRAPHLLVFAMRPVDPAPRLLDAARTSPGFAPLPLQPLSHADSLALLAGVPDAAVRERLAREAAGNPLFLQELARVAPHAGGALPPTLLAAVALEVGALSQPARGLLEGAAVAGDPFDPELAAAAAELGPAAALSALDELVAADLVRATGHARGFRFRHPLVLRAVYDGSAPAWRLAAHERVAAALQDRGAGATARAYHVEQSAGPGDEAAIELLAEAAAATADTAPTTSARWYDAAARLLPDAAGVRRAWLLAPMARSLAAAGRLEESRTALVEVLGLLPEDATEVRLALVAACAGVEHLLGRHADARRRLLAALDDAPPDQYGALALELALTAFYVADGPAILEWSARAASSTEDPRLLVTADALHALGELWRGEAHAAYEQLDCAAARFAALDDDQLASRIGTALDLAAVELLHQRFAAAAATARRGLEVARATQQGHVLVSLLTVSAMAHSELLDMHAATAAIEAAEESARLQGAQHPLQFALWARAMVCDLRGDAPEAERAADECSALIDRLEPSNVTRTGRCNLAAIRADQDPERAIREMLAAAGPNLEEADPTWSTWLLGVLVRASLALGRGDDAERWAQRATDQADALALPAATARAACARAEVLLAEGEPARAAQLARMAIATAERAGARRVAACARILAGRALGAAGEREEALAALQRAAADAARGGALRLRDEAARELRRLGARVSGEGRRAGAPAGREGLTVREREIAGLVAEGRTNKQVAAALFLSDRTIEHNLSRIYAKLGVRSRTELAGTLAR
jgi:DNA-binding NarL/FixJ family response regulator